LTIEEKHSSILDYCRKNKIFYLKADIQIPDQVYNEAAKLLEDGLFFDHRSGDGRGWASSTLHGKAIDVTHYDITHKPDYHWTRAAEYAPSMVQWMKEEFPNNGKYGRCRFMLLKPGGFIRAHTDTHKYTPGMDLKSDLFGAVNICITQPSNCYLRSVETKEEVPFKPTDVFWFDNGPFHEAANFSRENRFHFIIHGGSNKARKQLFIDSFEKVHGII